MAAEFAMNRICTQNSPSLVNLEEDSYKHAKIASKSKRVLLHREIIVKNK